MICDLSADIGQMLFEGEGINEDDSPSVWVDAILDRWPDASADEIERGFLIAIELGKADDEETQP